MASEATSSDSGSSDGPLQVEREEVLQDLLITDPLRPAVGSEDCPVEGGVGKRQPSRSDVIEVGEDAPFEIRRNGTFGVQPALAEAVDLLGCLR